VWTVTASQPSGVGGISEDCIDIASPMKDTNDFDGMISHAIEDHIGRGDYASQARQ